jgi:CheY-like chemotaxis protein
MASGKSNVLYIEDEESDRLLMQLAFKKTGLEPALQMVSHGEAAIDYLSGVGAYGDREKYPLPAVVLLDLHLPGLPGFEVLKWIRGQSAHRELPVVVFTSSAREEDRRRAELLGASDYVQKPGMAGGFQEVARRLNEEWLAGRPAPTSQSTFARATADGG